MASRAPNVDDPRRRQHGHGDETECGDGQATLRTATLIYDDQSLLAKAMPIIAAMQGGDPATSVISSGPRLIIPMYGLDASTRAGTARSTRRRLVGLSQAVTHVERDRLLHRGG